MSDKDKKLDVKIVDVKPTGEKLHVDVTTRVGYRTDSGTIFYVQHTRGTDGVSGTTSAGVNIPIGGPKR